MDQTGAQNSPAFKKVRNSDGSETVHYAAFGEEIPNECYTLPERQRRETQEEISRGIKSLKKFSEDKGLPQTDDVYLLAILRNCKCDLKKSKLKLEKFLRVKEMLAEKVAQMDLDKVNAILNDVCFAILPYRDKHGRLIFMTQPTFSLDAYSLDDGFICGLVLLLYSLTYPTTSQYGLAYIGGTKTHSLSLLYQILIAYKSWLKTLFDLPISIQKIDITNDFFLIRWFLKFVRHVVPARVYKRISVHGGNLETLKKTYHPDLLPEELGGNLGPLSTKHFRDKLLDFMRKLKDEHLAKREAEILLKNCMKV